MLRYLKSEFVLNNQHSFDGAFILEFIAFNKTILSEEFLVHGLFPLNLLSMHFVFELGNDIL